jgi:GMP synthase (glutamine-hydrolysing)
MDIIVVLDFGGQYCHLISRRIRDLGICSIVLPSDINHEVLKKIPHLKGIILSGGAASVYEKDSPKIDEDIFDVGVPLLGICYGHQLIAHLEGGEIESGKKGEYGLAEMKISDSQNLLFGFNKIENVWMNHRDIIKSLPKNYKTIATTQNCPIASFENKEKKVYGIQFHPEVSHTKKGNEVLENFALKICGAKREWKISNIIDDLLMEIRQKIGNKRAIIGLSGGIDSSTAAILVNKILKENLIAVYVDTGLMRNKETEFINKEFSKYDLNLKIVNAEDRFFKALEGITDPEQKRKIIGRLFIEVFDEIAKVEKADVLIQGTIYSDRIESGSTKNSSIIKSHHNVGGLPKNMRLELFEPLKELYKDEVRKIAIDLGLSTEIIKRHVFPGPGLAVRIIGEVTPGRAKIVRDATFIIERELKKSRLYDKIWMAFAILLPIKSVGIQGDSRSYKFPLVIRIIESKDAMTANFAKIPYEILDNISTRITNEIPDVNRVVYDISNKPPATMEWE